MLVILDITIKEEKTCQSGYKKDPLQEHDDGMRIYFLHDSPHLFQDGFFLCRISGRRHTDTHSHLCRAQGTCAI